MGSSGSGDDLVAREINSVENTTDLVGSRAFGGVGNDFQGDSILKVGPNSEQTILINRILDAVWGLGWSRWDPPEPGGTGVVGFSGINQGIGVKGLGAGFPDGKGGIGVHGVGGDGGILPPLFQSPDPVPQGIGVLGVGGKPAPDSPGPGAAGVLGVAGGPANGVEGISDANDNSGVFGFNSQKGGFAFGVFGRCDSREGAGVSGRNDNGDGVSSFSVAGNAIKGRSV